MRRITIDKLPSQTDEEIRSGPTYAVEREDRIVGYFLPVKEIVSEKVRRGWTRGRRRRPFACDQFASSL
jgi:hypothetical protein